MSVTDRSRQSAARRLDDLPEFGLGYLLDDEETPTTVTVFSESDGCDITTHWIAIDAGSAVPLEDVR